MLHIYPTRSAKVNENLHLNSGLGPKSLCCWWVDRSLLSHENTHPSSQKKKTSVLPHYPVHTILIKAPLEMAQAILFPLIKANADSFNEMRLIRSYQWTSTKTLCCWSWAAAQQCDYPVKGILTCIVHYHGIPDTLLKDNSSQFSSSLCMQSSLMHLDSAYKYGWVIRKRIFPPTRFNILHNVLLLKQGGYYQ